MSFAAPALAQTAIELLKAHRRLQALGPSLLVLGQHSRSALRGSLLATSRAIGTELAAQGLGAITLGESGLAEVAASSCENSGGRALRCRFSHDWELDGDPEPDGESAPGADALLFHTELARRTAVAKYARATLALHPSTEAISTLHFLASLARVGILGEHSILLLGVSQWNSAHFSIFHDAPVATRLIENSDDLLRGLDLG